MSNTPPTRGAALRKARVDAGLSQKEFAERAGICRATLQNVETGRHKPAGLTAQRIRSLLEQLASKPNPDKVTELEQRLDVLDQHVNALLLAKSEAVA